MEQPERRASSTRRTPSTPTKPSSVGRPPGRCTRNALSQRLVRLVRSAAPFACERLLRAPLPRVAIMWRVANFLRETLTLAVVGRGKAQSVKEHPLLPNGSNSTRTLSRAGGRNRKVHNTGIQRRRPRSATSNDHKVITNARPTSRRHAQIHANSSRLTGAQRQLFRFHLVHELTRVRYCNAKSSRRADVSDREDGLPGAAPRQLLKIHPCDNFHPLRID